MKTEELNKLKAQYAQKGIEIYIDTLVKTQERVLYYQKRLDSLSKKSKFSEDEKKQKTELEANIKSYKDGIEESEIHIELLNSLIESYTENKPVTL